MLLVLSIWLGLLCGCDSSGGPQRPRREDQIAPTFQLELKGHSFQVELADTPQLQRQGLSGREYLPFNGGMLFALPAPSRMSMWMKGCRIPLDVLFFDGEKRLINFHTMAVASPGQLDHSLPVYSSDKPAKYALEVPAGTSGRLGLEHGCTMSFSGELLKALDKGTE